MKRPIYTILMTSIEILKMAIEVFNDINSFPERFRGGYYAIGNFDGLHQGHQKVIHSAIGAAAREDKPAIVISFEPPPISFFKPDQPPQRLMLPETKARYLERLGISALLNLKFDQSLAMMPAGDFIKTILQNQLRAKYIAAGQNFRFGKGRQGDADFLHKWMGGLVDIIPSLMKDNQPISSTSIRKALAEGQPQKAAQYLGRWWQIMGPVIPGSQRGKQTGFATINLSLQSYLCPAFGVYAARIFIRGQWFDGVVNIGTRPTFGDDTDPLLEAHLFSTDGNFYGETAQVFLLHFLRPEKKFDNVEALKTQIEEDVKTTRIFCKKIVTKNTHPFWEIG